MFTRLFRSSPGRTRSAKAHRISRRILAVERLEERALLSVTPLTASLAAASQLPLDASGGSAALVGQDVGVAANATIATIAGNGQAGWSGDRGPATKAKLNQPQGVAVDGRGNVFVADSWNDVVREVYKNGEIRTIRGRGAVYGFPVGLAVDRAGTVLFIAEQQNEVIHKIDLLTGAMTRYAGAGIGVGNPNDGGPATQARLVLPTDLALDKNGDLYITEGGSISPHNRIRKVDHATGRISTIVGGGQVFGLNNIGSVAVDDKLNIFFISDGRIMEADSAGKNIRTLATPGGGTGLAVDPAGNTVYFCQGQQVFKLQGGAVSPVAGNGTRGYGGDNGAALQAKLNYPADVALDSQGILYIADSHNNRIRATRPAKPLAPQLAARPISTSQVELLWNPVDGARSYDVWMSDGGKKKLLRNVSGTSYVVGNLKPGISSRYSVVAKNAAGATASAWIACAPARAELKGNSLVVFGTDKDDKIVVGQTGNRISINGLPIAYNGKLETDVYSGLVGEIRVYGGGGNDTIDLNAGNQPIYASASIAGGPGNDSIAGVQGGSNIIYGDEGNDRIKGGNRDDKLYGGSGNDQLFGLAGNDQLHGDSGNDFLDAGSIDEAVDFGPNPSGRDKDFNAYKPIVAGNRMTDFTQVAGPNCFLLASLGSAAERESLDGRIRYLGDSQYEVLLFDAKSSLWKWISARFEGKVDPADPQPTVTGRSDFWPILFRRAYVALKGSDNGGMAGDALNALTGRTSDWYQAFRRNGTVLRFVTRGLPPTVTTTEMFDEMASALQQRKLVVVDHLGTDAHSYTLVAVRRNKDGDPLSATVRNPWFTTTSTWSWVKFLQEIGRIWID